MVCSKCGVRQIIHKKGFFCPKCKDISLLTKDLAIKVAQKQIDWFDNGFKQVLSRFNKRRLLAWLFWEREKIATQFFNRPLLKLSDFLSVTVLIKRVMQDFDTPGEEVANEKNTAELVNLFTGYVQVFERKILIKEDFAHYIAEKDFDLEKMDMKSLMANFKFVENEDLIPVTKSFETNLVVSEPLAKSYFEEHKEKYERLRKARSNSITRTPEEAIEALFPFLQSFFTALTKNELYADTFDLKYLKKAGISPKFVLNFIQKFPQKPGILTRTDAERFEEVVKTNFKEYDEKVIYDALVFSNSNQNIFPFFINLDGNILISHNFIRLMALFYYPFFYNHLFSSEINRRSKFFEKKIVPERLRELGFKVKLNITDKKNPSLEVDQIAWRGHILYVVETKVWDLKPFFEHRRIHNYRKRDLQGVVDGKKYSTIAGEGRVEDIPGLNTKVSFIQNNLKEYCLDHEMIKEVKGLVITRSHPSISEYKGVRFLGFSKLEDL